MFIAIENGQFINENEIFQITFGQSPHGATVLAFTADGENPRRGDVIDENELHVVEAMVKRPGWVKMADGATYTNLNRSAYVVFAHVPTVGDTARIFIAGRQMHFAKDQDVVKSLREALMSMGREDAAVAASPAALPPGDTDSSDQDDTPPPT